jgi:hypothetical protein
MQTHTSFTGMTLYLYLLFDFYLLFSFHLEEGKPTHQETLLDVELYKKWDLEFPYLLPNNSREAIASSLRTSMYVYMEYAG